MPFLEMEENISKVLLGYWAGEEPQIKNYYYLTGMEF